MTVYSTLGEKWMRPHVLAWLRERTDFQRIEHYRVDMSGYAFHPRVGRKPHVVMESIAVELKLSDVAGVVKQAERNSRRYSKSYVCMPEDVTRKSQRLVDLCRASEVGLLSVSPAGHVFENIAPAHSPGDYWTRRSDCIHRSWLRSKNDPIEFMAAQSPDQKKVSAWRRLIEKVGDFGRDVGHRIDLERLCCVSPDAVAQRVVRIEKITDVDVYVKVKEFVRLFEEFGKRHLVASSNALPPAEEVENEIEQRA